MLFLCTSLHSHHSHVLSGYLLESSKSESETKKKKINSIDLEYRIIQALIKKIEFFCQCLSA